MFVQGEDRSHNDGVTGVHTDGIHILHPADGDGLVVGVTHDFKFDLLVTFDALFNQHLVNGRKPEGIDADLHKFFLIVCKSASRSAESKSRTQYNGIADFFSSPLCVLQVIGNLRGDDRLADGLAHFLKKLTVFGPLNALAAGAQKLNPAFAQNTFPLKLHCKVQSCLPADAGDNGIRPFIAQNFGYIVKCQRLHVNLIGNRGIRHDGSGIGVDQHNLVALFFERQAGLRARIVELRRLADHNRAGPDDQHFFNVRSLCHILSPHSRLLSHDRPSANSARRPYDLQRVLPGQGKEIPQG